MQFVAQKYTSLDHRNVQPLHSLERYRFSLQSCCTSCRSHLGKYEIRIALSSRKHALLGSQDSATRTRHSPHLATTPFPCDPLHVVLLPRAAAVIGKSCPCPVQLWFDTHMVCLLPRLCPVHPLLDDVAATAGAGCRTAPFSSTQSLAEY